MTKHYRTENNCLNCGATDLKGHFCHVCGQENLEIKESFGHMMNHAISDYFHFDHQFFHTIKPLLFKPGFLTHEYMAGKRAQFLHPVKMYIFISVVYFLLVFKSGGGQLVEIDNSDKKQVPASGAVNHQIKKPEAGYTQYDAKGNKTKESKLFIIDGDSTLAQYKVSQQKLPAEKRDDFFSRTLSEKCLVYNDEYGNHAREQFTEDIQHNVPKMMFVLLPLFALFLGIAFRKNKKFYVEHLIYTFHFHCFLFLFASIIILVEMAMPPGWKEVKQWINFAGLIYVFWYFYKSLRVVYARSKFRTITKMIGLALSDVVTLIVCSILLVFITALF